MDRDLQSNSISLNDRVFLIPEPDKVMNHEYNECCELNNTYMRILIKKQEMRI